ncbi:cytochrome P450 71A1-like [Senna tora]|uniref:Cytochrome P450 71A1-like n=1 Tax=Senna tora TaxID=362788 RepID=A0A834X6C0_9FABA|nr:cytochrome P450 71A1-like [Senna tora]
MPLTLLSLVNQNPTIFYTLLLTLFSFALFLFKNRVKTTKSKWNLPPSPPKLPIIGHLHHHGTLPHRYFRDLSLKHGPLLWLNLARIPALLVSSANFAKEIIKHQDTIFADRFQSVSSRILTYGCKDISYASYGEIWRHKRKISTLGLLSQRRIRSFQFVREEEVSDLVDKIRRACINNNNCCVDVTELVTSASNCIISRCVIRKKFDEEDSICKFGELIRKLIIQLAELSMGDLFPWLGWVDFLTGKIGEFKDTFRALDAFFEEVLADHKKKMKRDDGNKDFVDILLQLQEDDMLGFDSDQDDLKAVLTDMFLGGNDTTSTTTEWTLTELMKHPSIMKKAQEEVRKVVGNKSKVEESDINEMKYVKLVVKETLRLHPPAPFLAPRETISDTKLGGYDIPRKTVIFFNTWAIHRDPEVWERAEEFIPERFEKTKIDFKGQDFGYFPFGFGKRICPGMKFGLTSVEYILANLLYWFEWKLPEGEDCDNIDMSETYGLTVKKKVPLCLEPKLYSFQSQTDTSI